MSIHPLKSDAPLIVYVDIKSPYAFVAIKPTLALEVSLGVPFDWRPLTLDIRSYHGNARKEGGKVVEDGRTPEQWATVKYRYMDTRRYAERQGYVLKGTEKIWDSSIANIGIFWVMERSRDRLPAYFDAVYPPFWRRELDIENVDVVASCLDAAGVDSAGFDAYQRSVGRDKLNSLYEQLHPAGIYGVPTYVFDGETLSGREHLPYIGWYLGGRKGPAPDIEYEI